MRIFRSTKLGSFRWSPIFTPHVLKTLIRASQLPRLKSRQLRSITLVVYMVQLACENSRPSSLPVRVARAVSEEGRFQLTVSQAMSNSFKPLLCHSSKLPLSDVFFRKGRLQPLLFHPTPIRVLFLPEFLKYLSIDFQLSL